MSASPELIIPNWPAPDSIGACTTTRHSGVAGVNFNLAMHVQDNPETVLQNRATLVQTTGLPEHPRWLDQIHGNLIVDASDVSDPVSADACFSDQSRQVCAVLTADCLPLLLTNNQGTQVAAVHAGWRGLDAGIIAAAVARFGRDGTTPDSLLAWMGPAIGGDVYEIDDALRERYLANNPKSDTAFNASRPGHWFMNLYTCARLQLDGLGVNQIFGGDYCTQTDERFFSFRRDPDCGRQATLIWRRE